MEKVNTRDMMSQAKFYESYSRYIDEEVRHETWDESVDRVMNMHREYYEDKMNEELDSAIRFATKAYKDKRILGAQRALQFGGDQLLKHNSKIFNCFAAGTKFITSEGVKSFSDFEEGDACLVLTHKGKWKNAVVKSYGEQRLYDYTFSKGTNRSHKLSATANHRWILKDGQETTSLSVGDMVMSQKGHKSWRVSDISECFRREKVWCLEVEDDQSFTLANGMVTGNCTASYCDRPEFFGEAMYQALSGAGVGFSVQFHHINKLPPIAPRKSHAKQFVVEDSIEGWAKAVDVLLSSFFVGGKHPEYEGRKIYFDTNHVRPKGAKISGGFKAPGPEPLENALSHIERLLTECSEKLIGDDDTFQLEPIHCYDILMYAMDSVISGGVRRSASICLFSPDDKKMMKAKTGNWFVENPQRGRSNNSVLIVRKDINKKEFNDIFENVKQYGEPGFIFAENDEHMFNPCFTGDTVIAVADSRNGVTIKDLAEQDKAFQVYSAAPGKIKKWKTQIKNAIAFKTSEKLTIKVTLSDGDTFKCTDDHKIALPNGTYVEARESVGLQVESFFSTNAKHCTVPGIEDESRWKHNLSIASFLENNSKFSSITNEELIKNGKLLLEMGKKITFRNLKVLDNRTPLSFPKDRFNGKLDELREICEGQLDYHLDTPKKINKKTLKSPHGEVYVSKVEYTGDIEEVYDIKTEENNNFYILTSGDENYENSKGLLVHNCCEISMLPYDQETGESGWQGCNLTEINGGKCTSEELLLSACKAASIIGTLQAGYTNFKFLSPVSKKIYDKEALIGVSITGWMNNPDVLFDEKMLKRAARLVKSTNKSIAKLIDINPAARTTTVKPSGNASTLLSTASGIHAEHSKKYIRNVQMNKDSEVAQLVKDINPYMIEESVYSTNFTDYVISFPIIPKEGSIYRKELRNIEFLEKVKLVQQSWIEEGTNKELCADPTLRHNVSNTVTVDSDKWDEVRDYVFDNRKYFAGISFLAATGDKDYNQAPNTEVLDLEELTEKYGVAAVFASGLIVDSQKGFRDLWEACGVIRYGETDAPQEKVDQRAEWLRRFNKFSDNYFGGDLMKTEYCLKDCYLLWKWEKINNNLKPVDFQLELTEKKYTEVDTLGAIACSGTSCEVVF